MGKILVVLNAFLELGLFGSKLYGFGLVSTLSSTLYPTAAGSCLHEKALINPLPSGNYDIVWLSELDICPEKLLAHL